MAAVSVKRSIVCVSEIMITIIIIIVIIIIALSAG